MSNWKRKSDKNKTEETALREENLTQTPQPQRVPFREVTY